MATARKTSARSTRPLPIEDRAKEALAVARKSARTMKTWVDLSNLLYGIGGKCGELFPTPSDRAQFARTPEYKQIAELIGSLPAPSVQRSAHGEDAPSGQLRVRMPRSLHAALIAEAECEGVSLNQLILSKLNLQVRALLHTG